MLGLKAPKGPKQLDLGSYRVTVHLGISGLNYRLTAIILGLGRLTENAA